jgi:tripartite-type tricarboxylate transporter receptor subunit TctC
MPNPVRQTFNRSAVGTCVVLAAATVIATLDAHGQEFPVKTVRIIVPFAPGGASDVSARITAPKFGEMLGQPVVIENRAGANGIVGTEVTAKSPADGYTVLMATNGTHAVNISLYPKLSYDPLRDFVPITEVVSLTNILVVHPSLPVKSVKELIALARSKPGELNYGSGGNGGTPHLSGELFKSMAKIDLTHVPYKGGGLSTTALLSGEVAMTFNTMLTSINLIKSGRLRPLGVTGAKRSPLMPNLPTIAEAGVPGYEASTWYGLVAPAGTPKHVVGRLHTGMVKALGVPEVRHQLVSQGADPVGNSPAEFESIIRADIVKWAKVVKASGARPD